MRSILPRPFIALTALLAALLSLILYDFNYIVVSLIHLDFAHVPSSISPLTDPAVTAGLQGAHNYRVQSGNESLGVWLIPASNATKPAERAVIYFHGQAGSRGQGHRIELYKMLANRLSMATRQEPPGRVGVLEDIRTIVDWTGKMLGNNTLPVYVYGHSLGGPQALYAARYMVKTGRRVSGCILESTFVEFPRTAAQHPMTLPLWFLPRGHPPAMKDPTRFDYYTGRQLRLLRLEAPGMPVINFHGLSDWQISPENARALKESVGGVDYTTVFIDGGGHSDLHTGDHQDRMVRALREWFPQTANRSSTVY
ncbi:Monoacylglycerol lipase abhd12 [Perkinsus olseni]|uniref:Monoacylglycerol lipase abhd12 n=1 Tax=Perkinsus olseni TaxID=32597 RepID=A0A7J6NSW1_PEROL|nr:Monoacylglycerol lipase abhd12 [Perkinsus olseni]